MITDAELKWLTQTVGKRHPILNTTIGAKLYISLQFSYMEEVSAFQAAKQVEKGTKWLLIMGWKRDRKTPEKEISYSNFPSLFPFGKLAPARSASDTYAIRSPLTKVVHCRALPPPAPMFSASRLWA